MKKALVVDWLDKYGGAEKVIQALEHALQFHEVHALVNVMQTAALKQMFPKQQKIRTTFLQVLGKKFRFSYPFFFFGIKKIMISNDVDLIISSSHSVAKGVQKTNKNQIHISYFQAPNSNYIWQDAPLYFKKAYPLIKWLLPIFRKWDFKQAQNPDFIICNSKFVQNWVQLNYQRKATVIYPPVNLSAFPLKTIKQDFYVIAGRIATIKRFDLVIEAFNTNGKRLIVIGDGDQLNHLKSKAVSSQIEFLGFQNAAVLSHYLQNAKALIQMGVEGFGIAAIEANSCGTPVICYEKGGITETVLNHQTGLFFKEQSAQALNACIATFETKDWNYQAIHEHAQQFSAEQFEKQIIAFVEKHTNNKQY
ncbi:glycosyltransferase [Flavobacterium sp. CBA20B-1]|uniref:glycosyltransferase n=1 Tax=unclassified Flavobacterium TaxID=196869 RepID=UPI0022245769|nr:MULTISPECIES: glycosyltransferase [unclassified Flavobacterium]WCM41188.1 glycosyltransferase [Flavobacterium sp. CBA20B-1]